MRIGYAVAVAALLAGAPAMADVVVSTGNNGDATRHEYRADQDRAAGHQEMNDAHQQAAVGNYGAAAQDQSAARQDMHAAHRQQDDAAHDSSGVTVQVGH